MHITETHQKFQIGDTVYNTIERRGSYEPSTCRPYTKLTVDSIEKSGDGFIYTCGYDGYKFTDHELMSAKEYHRMLTAEPVSI